MSVVDPNIKIEPHRKEWCAFYKKWIDPRGFKPICPECGSDSIRRYLCDMAQVWLPDSAEWHDPTNEDSGFYLCLLCDSRNEAVEWIKVSWEKPA